METARSVFHAQLASTMDTLLASAVCEIVKIFESSLSQHQAELLQKTNEISILRRELEKVQRRCAEKATQSLDTDDQPISKSEHCENPPDQVQALFQNVSGIKEEPQSLEEAAESTPELNGSQSTIQAEHVQPKQPLSPERLSPVQCKDEVLDWDESIHSAAQLHEDVAPSPPFLSISPKICSDTSQAEGLVPGLSYTQESTMENFKANKINCPAPINGHPEFVVDGCLEDNYGTFLEQEPGNLASSHGIIQSAPREEDGLTTHMKQGSVFRSRDRPQSNFHTFSLRNMESLSHHPAASGVNGGPYSCPYCGKCFAYPSHQKRHLLRHTGLRLHSCQFCEKSFLTPSELAVHTRTHTGERPFGCGQCGKRFARSGNLRAHQRDVHLGKRPFACAECGKRFAHKGNLRVHNHRVHNGLLTSATDSHRL